ncbi:hypothetical protein B0H12DRAFT_523408 [Mycena haematopus]|nr:hypothetical protein B0H12DRAFT_523408 [Mycena haematopus]
MFHQNARVRSAPPRRPLLLPILLSRNRILPPVPFHRLASNAKRRRRSRHRHPLCPRCTRRRLLVFSSSFIIFFWSMIVTVPRSRCAHPSHRLQRQRLPCPAPVQLPQ